MKLYYIWDTIVFTFWKRSSCDHYDVNTDIVISFAIFFADLNWKCRAGSIKQGTGKHLNLWYFLLFSYTHFFSVSYSVFLSFNLQFACIHWCSKLWQALLRSDLPSYMVPFSVKDLLFHKPEVCDTQGSFNFPFRFFI